MKYNWFNTFNTTLNYVLFCGFLSCASLMQVTSTFWAATQPLLKAERATIPNLKEERQGFNMRPIAEIFYGKIALKSSDWHRKSQPPLVHFLFLLASHPVNITARNLKLNVNRLRHILFNMGAKPSKDEIMMGIPGTDKSKKPSFKRDLISMPTVPWCLVTWIKTFNAWCAWACPYATYISAGKAI